MKNTATMFLNDLTIIDHAYIDDQGFVVGGTFSATPLVTGTVCPKENVVVDFSTCKKQLKALIDDHARGYDHKLWIIEGYSNCEVGYDHDGDVIVKTPHVEMCLTQDAIKVIGNGGQRPGYEIPFLQSQMSNYLNHRLDEAGLPFIRVNMKLHEKFSTQTYLTPEMGMFSTVVPFRYSHGLKESTSYGCKNIGHGHLSYVELITPAPLSDVQMHALHNLMAPLNGAIMVNPENIVTEDGESIFIEYRSDERGYFSQKINKTHPYIVMETETTIENIVGMVNTELGDFLDKIGCMGIYVSEGLTKGAFIERK